MEATEVFAWELGDNQLVQCLIRPSNPTLHLGRSADHVSQGEVLINKTDMNA